MIDGRRACDWAARGAALVTDSKKVALLCHNYHAKPRRECVHGVPAGDVSGFAGLCAYKH